MDKKELEKKLNKEYKEIGEITIEYKCKNCGNSFSEKYNTTTKVKNDYRVRIFLEEKSSRFGRCTYCDSKRVIIKDRYPTEETEQEQQKSDESAEGYFIKTLELFNEYFDRRIEIMEKFAEKLENEEENNKEKNKVDSEDIQKAISKLKEGEQMVTLQFNVLEELVEKCERCVDIDEVVEFIEKEIQDNFKGKLGDLAEQIIKKKIKNKFTDNKNM